ncbi:MAG: DUF3047 domain-containing protein [Thermodesulfobacteriota bacterium]
MARLLSVLLLMLCLAAPARAGSCLREDFDSLAGWSEYAPLRADRLTGYGPAQVDGRRVLEARSRDSVSGLVSKAGLDLANCPRLRWAWRVESPLPAADLAARAGDDAPLRIMVLFYSGPGEDAPHSALGYVWGNREEVGLVLRSPGQERTRLKVLRSGAVDCGRWIEEAADVAADYRAAFGAKPPAFARLAVMNDSDDTHGGAVAYLDYIEAGP